MIKVYSLPTCGQCKVLKMKLAAKGVEYEEISGMEKLEPLGLKGVPVLEFEDGSRLNQIEAIKWINSQEVNK